MNLQIHTRIKGGLCVFLRFSFPNLCLLGRWWIMLWNAPSHARMYSHSNGFLMIFFFDPCLPITGTSKRGDVHSFLAHSQNYNCSYPMRGRTSTQSTDSKSYFILSCSHAYIDTHTGKSFVPCIFLLFAFSSYTQPEEGVVLDLSQALRQIFGFHRNLSFAFLKICTLDG